MKSKNIKRLPVIAFSALLILLLLMSCSTKSSDDFVSPKGVWTDQSRYVPGKTAQYINGEWDKEATVEAVINDGRNIEMTVNGKKYIGKYSVEQKYPLVYKIKFENGEEMLGSFGKTHRKDQPDEDTFVFSNKTNSFTLFRK